MARRTDLRKIRDKKLVEVYHKLSDIERMKSEDALMMMEQKIFFIDARRIYALIFYDKDNHAYYEQLLAGADINSAIERKVEKFTNKNQLHLGI